MITESAIAKSDAREGEPGRRRSQEEEDGRRLSVDTQGEKPAAFERGRKKHLGSARCAAGRGSARGATFCLKKAAGVPVPSAPTTATPQGRSAGRSSRPENKKGRVARNGGGAREGVRART
jgi:hypothetical protein